MYKMLGNFGGWTPIIVLGVIITVALGLLKKIEIDTEVEFKIPVGYKSEFDFEWELEKNKEDQKIHEKKVAETKDSIDLNPPVAPLQPASTANYYYPFYPSVGVPPLWPRYYW
jgi:hypothetical protein